MFFSLIQLIMNQQYDEIYHQVALILQGQSNNAINVLSLLLRNYRLAYKIRTCNCSLKEIGVYGNSYVPRLSAKPVVNRWISLMMQFEKSKEDIINKKLH